MSDGVLATETVTLSEAQTLMHCLATEHSLLLLSPPGVGKSASVVQAAARAGLDCRSLLGTQIAPEDVSGIPRIVGERSVFCPPRVLLPERPDPFCLFLDELPAAAPDIQKAFYSLLLERRIGEHALPPGAWVVAAGNRAEDRALVRTMSSALVNRVIVLNVRVDVREWLIWAKQNGIRADIMAFIVFLPQVLMRETPREPRPFSTPRAWAALSGALCRAEQAGVLTPALHRALAFGCVSAEDAAVFCTVAEEGIEELQPAPIYVEHPDRLPTSAIALWFLLNRIRSAAAAGEFDAFAPAVIQRFLEHLPDEHRFAVLVDQVALWGRLGASEVLLSALKQATGLDA